MGTVVQSSRTSDCGSDSRGSKARLPSQFVGQAQWIPVIQGTLPMLITINYVRELTIC